jgi:hypothetical protein
MLFVNNPENFHHSLKIIAEKFGGYQKKLYLCIRFRPKSWVGGIKRKSSLKDFHKQTSSTRSEMATSP